MPFTKAPAGCESGARPGNAEAGVQAHRSGTSAAAAWQQMPPGLGDEGFFE